ncbi:MAG: Threonine dehydratase, catabolic [Ignavibacteriae bacterium]|nr:MAG: Threonine dehydratase, catabolic [Ignavibacteriota bacterium]
MVTLNDILIAQSRIKNVAHKTPILTSSTFNDLTGLNVFFKSENFQKIGAFKIRGAYNKISSLNEKERKVGIITHSSGNHAQGVALSCKILNTRAYVVMPSNSTQKKVEAVKSYCAEVIFCGETTDDREKATQELIDKYGYTFVHPYDDDFIIAGQGTVALEIFDELKDLDYIFIPVGGGGLISGCSIVTRSISPNTKVIGVETEDANDCYQSFKKKELVKLNSTNTIADGMRTLSVGRRNFEIIMKYVDDIVTVKDDDVIEMMKFFLERMKIVVEPTGAVASAALLKNVLSLKNKNVCAIISGGNVDLKILNQWIG